eukprot:SAG31_NODE_39526_length_287_cov_1.106383_1_plen_60_part_01
MVHPGLRTGTRRYGTCDVLDYTYHGARSSATGRRVRTNGADPTDLDARRPPPDQQPSYYR